MDDIHSRSTYGSLVPSGVPLWSIKEVVMLGLHIPENFVVLILMVAAVVWFIWAMMRYNVNGKD